MSSALKTQTIPVYPVVQKFLQFHYATKPFVIGYDLNPYSSFLLACLDRYPTKVVPRENDRLTYTLTVGMSAWQARHGFGSNLSPIKVLAFNKFVKSAFLDKLVTEVKIRVECGMELNEAVTRFLLRYQLSEDELSLLTVLRYYYRHQKRLSEAGHSSLTLSSRPDVARHGDARSVDVIRPTMALA